jgi:hypothetical protein
MSPVIIKTCSFALFIRSRSFQLIDLEGLVIITDRIINYQICLTM